MILSRRGFISGLLAFGASEIVRPPTSYFFAPKDGWELPTVHYFTSPSAWYLNTDAAKLASLTFFIAEKRNKFINETSGEMQNGILIPTEEELFEYTDKLNINWKAIKE